MSDETLHFLENGSSYAKKIRKKPFRFSASNDILLLKEVLVANPYHCQYGSQNATWEEVARKVSQQGIFVDWRRCRDHTSILLSQFKKQDMENLRKSGTEEEYEEKESLLQEIADIMAEKETRKQTEKSDRLLIKEAALNGRLTPSSVSSGSPAGQAVEEGDDISHQSFPTMKRRRTTQDLCLEFLMEKSRQNEARHAAEIRLKEEELALRKRELELKEKEIEHRMALEANEQDVEDLEGCITEVQDDNEFTGTIQTVKVTKNGSVGAVLAS